MSKSRAIEIIRNLRATINRYRKATSIKFKNGLGDAIKMPKRALVKRVQKLKDEYNITEDEIKSQDS